MYAQSTTFILPVPHVRHTVDLRIHGHTHMHTRARATVRAVHACAMHATERLCCFFSPSWKIGRGENGELPLCSLFVLRVYTMDHHGRNCCVLSRDVAWRFHLSGWCAMCFGSARSRYPRTTDLEKVSFAVFKFAEGLPVVRFQKPKKHPWLKVQAKLL